MKKISFLLALVLLLSLLTGCGGDEQTPDTTSPAVNITVQPLEGDVTAVDTTGMTYYDLGCGLSFYGPSGMEGEEIDGLAAYYHNGFFLLMVIEEPKEDTILADVDLEGYAEMLTTQNALDPCIVDQYGSLATTYVAEGISGDSSYFYYTTVRETADSFWLLQMTCPDSVAEKYVDSMAQWSATITETKTAE